jgi:regulator of cell morphogenesis and NO signaling
MNLLYSLIYYPSTRAMISLDQPPTVGQLVADDYRRAPVLNRFGIDFCCRGGVSLEVAARKAGVPIADVERALAAATTEAGVAQPRVEDWDPAFLAQYIVNQHHTFVRGQVPPLAAFTQKVARVHGERHPETVEIADRFERMAGVLERHMQREENEVFPRIADAAAGRPAGDLGALIDELETEHEDAGDLMREIRALSDDFTPPPDACNTYRAAYANLELFEADLHRHVHLENNVLFPKAVTQSQDARGQWQGEVGDRR